MGRSLKIAAFMAVIFISVFMLSLSAPAFAEGLTVNFYLDREDPAPFASGEITDGSLTVPEAIPEREGYTFDGWSDGFARYYPSQTYTVSEGLNLYAVWKGEEVIYERKPLLNKAEKTALYASLGVLGVILLFCFYWFGIKENGVKDLGRAIKKLFTKKPEGGGDQNT